MSISLAEDVKYFNRKSELVSCQSSMSIPPECITRPKVSGVSMGFLLNKTKVRFYHDF